LEFVNESTDVWPPQIVGFLCAALGMLVGSLWPSQGKPRAEGSEGTEGAQRS